MTAKRYPRLFDAPERREEFDQLSEAEQNEMWDEEHRMMLDELANPDKYKEREIAPGLFSRWTAPGIHATYVKPKA